MPLSSGYFIALRIGKSNTIFPGRAALKISRRVIWISQPAKNRLLSAGDASVPSDLQEASTVIGLKWWERLYKVELPFSAVTLAWNSLLSMAGGWFFLIPCEAMTLGDREYSLPGIGAYMDFAIKQGNYRATANGGGCHDPRKSYRDPQGRRCVGIVRNCQ